MEITPDMMDGYGTGRGFRSARMRHFWNPGGFQEVVWNPLAGCVPATFSEACLKCYALPQVKRNMGREKYIKRQEIWRPIYNPAQMLAPLKWGWGHRLVWVCNSSDFFLEMGVMRPTLDKIWALMSSLPQHTFVIITKRPENIMPYLEDKKTIPDNIWMGVSFEDQVTADTRIPQLIDTPFKTKVARYEPALHFSDFRRYLGHLAWVIVGGQSGQNASPANPNWVRFCRDICRVAGVPFWFEDWGRYSPLEIIPPSRRRGIMDWGVVDFHGNWLQHARLVREWGEERMIKKYATPLLDGEFWFQWPGVKGRQNIHFLARGEVVKKKPAPIRRYTRKLWRITKRTTVAAERGGQSVTTKSALKQAVKKYERKANEKNGETSN